MNDWRFLQIDRTNLIPHIAQSLTYLLRKPEGLNETVPYSIKRFSPFPLLQSNLLSLT
jgi:hypothetical protein